jgi:hypothetical protein
MVVAEGEAQHCASITMVMNHHDLFFFSEAARVSEVTLVGRKILEATPREKAWPSNAGDRTEESVNLGELRVCWTMTVLFQF